MSNILVLEKILKELRSLERNVEDNYVLLAVKANILRYEKELDDIRKQNALDVVAHKIAHLTKKLS